jgi:ribose transport system permease protein
MMATFESTGQPEAAPALAPERPSIGRLLNLGRYSGVYLLAILIVVFTIWVKDFGTLTNFRVVASGQAIAGILTLGLVVSLISGVFDISIAANMSFAISLVGWLQGTVHLNPAEAVILTLLCGALVGAINAFIITILRVDSIVGTLGMSAILTAAAFMLVDGKTILYGISPSFTKLGTGRWLSLPRPVFYLAAVAILLWFALEHTPWGRYLRAAGSNPVATRLSGIKVVRLQWTALIVSGTLGALAGVVLTMQLGAASFNAGAPYLLPAFAAAFLGATLIQPGRFNVLGTIVALYLLAVAVKGLQLRYPSVPWLAEFIQGVTLIVAVALSAHATRRRKA